MRLLSKLLITGGLTYVAIRVGRRLVQRARDQAIIDAVDDALIAEEVVIVGITEVDPDELEAAQTTSDRLEEHRALEKDVP